MLHYSTGVNANKSSLYQIENLPIRLAGVVRESIVDGPDLRFVVFVQGCPHDCPGCHNPETHDPDGGFQTSTAIIWREINKNPLVQGITFSGGEPFMWGHELAVIGRAAAEKKLNIMTYTGYTYEQLLQMAKIDNSVHELLCVTNYLKDGPYVEEKRDLSLQFRGSSNQRIFDVTCYPNTTAAKEVKTL